MNIRGFAQLGKMVHEKLFGKPMPAPQGEPTEHTLHLKWERCETCDGKGYHVNPSIDAHGISGEEFDEDPTFAEEYRAGMYDVSCYECHGSGSTLSIDRKRTNKESLRIADEYFADEAEYRRESEAERRAGA